MPAREPCSAKTDTKRASLLTCQLCASDTTVADDTYDHTFRLCTHPSVSSSGWVWRTSANGPPSEWPRPASFSGSTTPSSRRRWSSYVLLGNWNTSHITQLDQVIQPTDSVPALSEASSLWASTWSTGLTSFGLLVNEPLTTQPSPAPPTPTLSSSEPYSVGVSSVILPRPPPPQSSMQSDSAMYPVFTSLGERLNLRRWGPILT